MTNLNNMTFLTHMGSHHADDVVGRFLLESAGAFCYRGLTPANASDVWFDFGGGKFDHHQPDAELKADGSQFSAAGLIYREYSDIIVAALTRRSGLTPAGVASFKVLLGEFVDFIDANDNGVKVESRFSWFPQAVSQLNNISGRSVITSDYAGAAQKTSAQLMAETLLCETVVAGLINEAFASAVVLDSIVDGSSIVVLSEACPWSAPIQSFNALNPDKKILSVVFQSNREGWIVQQVPVAAGSFECISFLPKEWLEVAPAGLLFCHKNLFMAVFSTKEEAVAAALSL